MMQYVN